MHPLYRLPMKLLVLTVPRALAIPLVSRREFPSKFMVQCLSERVLLSRAQVLGPVVSRHRETERL